MEISTKKQFTIFSGNRRKNFVSPASYRSISRELCNSNRSAFTLIELLVVIAIIGLLVAIIAPSLKKAKMLAKKTACSASLHALGLAAALYQSDYGEYVPILFRNCDINDSIVKNPWQSWRVELLPYTNDFKAFNCPAAEIAGEIIHSKEELESQTESAGTSFRGSYGVILQYSLPTYKTENFRGFNERGSSAISLAFSTIPGVAWRDPTNSVYVADGYSAEGPIESPTTHSYKGYGTASINLPDSPPGESLGDYFGEAGPIRRFADRHLGTNCLFLGGRVGSFVTSELESMEFGESDCIWDTE